MTKTKEEEVTVVELANEIINIVVYDLDSELEQATNKLQSQLGRKNEKEYHDHENTKIALTNNLYERLINMKLSTIKRYVDNNQLIKRLISQVAKGTKDSEVNDGKVYTIDRELVTDSEGNAGVKQVRNYQSQVSFDYTTTNEDTFKLSDVISQSDIRVPAMGSFNKGLAIQVLKNIDMFTKLSRGFISLLFTEGSKKTKELLGMSTSRFNEKVGELETYIKKHPVKFDSILTYDEEQKLDSLTSMAQFEVMLDVAERTQIQKWLIDNLDTPWVEVLLNDVVDNDTLVIDSWDMEHERQNTYQFIDGLHKLEEQYKNEVLK